MEWKCCNGYSGDDCNDVTHIGTGRPTSTDAGSNPESGQNGKGKALHIIKLRDSSPKN